MVRSVGGFDGQRGREMSVGVLVIWAPVFGGWGAQILWSRCKTISCTSTTLQTPDGLSTRRSKWGDFGPFWFQVLFSLQLCKTV